MIILNKIISFSILIPAIIAGIKWKYKELRLVIIYLLGATGFEIGFDYLASNYLSNWWLLDVFLVFEFFTLGYWTLRQSPHSNSKRNLIWLTLFIAQILIGLYLFTEPSARSRIEQLSLLACCVIGFQGFFKLAEYDRLFKYSEFWIFSGLIFQTAFGALLYCITPYFNDPSFNHAIIVFQMLQYFTLIVPYTLFTKAFLCKIQIFR